MAVTKAKADEAYEAIERMIVFQQLVSGSLVSESMLTEQTGFGRTPVREALQRLARVGMVRIHPSKGVLIPPVTMESQLRLLELRRVLEVLAVQLACSRAKTQHRDSITTLLSRLRQDEFTLPAYLETVKDTHDLIVAAADNEFIADALAPAQALSRRFWIAQMRDEQEQIAAGSVLHSRILQAILDRDEDAARAASIALNDYLVDFAYSSLGVPGSSAQR